MENPPSRIPEEYQQHHMVFSKEQSQQLPSHSIWDHAIELLPGAPNSLPGQLLPLNLEEKAKIHKFIQEHLNQGTIRISKSPYAANFFFIKKKDGKLHPVQDYHPLNKWTKTNKNVSPLINQIIDHLSRCTLFTTLDVTGVYSDMLDSESSHDRSGDLADQG